MFFDGGQYFIDINWFGDEVIISIMSQLFDDQRICRQENHRDVFGFQVFLNLRAKFSSVDARKYNSHQNNIRLAIFDLRENILYLI